MSKALYHEIADTGNELQKVLSSFTQDQINIIPFSGSWTAGQVAEHILKSADGALQTVNGDTTTTKRDAGQYVGMLRDAFMNFNVKMTSPDFILPSDQPKNKIELSNSLASALDGLSEAARTKELSATCTRFEMPTIGLLTRLEWISFINFHTMRHIHQLKNFKQSFDNSKN